MTLNENQQNNPEAIKENKKNYKMSLLFIQTKELKRLYNSKMENKLKRYHIVNKSWLDEFKLKNDYKSAVETFDSFNEWKNYEDFRDLMGDSFLVNDELFTKVFSTVRCKRVKLREDIDYPKNFELVYFQYFLDSFRGTLACPLCQILIGDKSIILFDDEYKNKKRPIIYICSLKTEKEGEYSFEIQVDCVIIYKDMDTMNKELEEISGSKGIYNYLLKRKLDINNSEEQDVINDKLEIVGKFNIILNDFSYEEENNNSQIKENKQNNSNNNNDHKSKVLFDINDTKDKNKELNNNNNGNIIRNNVNLNNNSNKNDNMNKMNNYCNNNQNKNIGDENFYIMSTNQLNNDQNINNYNNINLNIPNNINNYNSNNLLPINAFSKINKGNIILNNNVINQNINNNDYYSNNNQNNIINDGGNMINNYKNNNMINNNDNNIYNYNNTNNYNNMNNYNNLSTINNNMSVSNNNMDYNNMINNRNMNNNYNMNNNNNESNYSAYMNNSMMNNNKMIKSMDAISISSKIN